MTYICAKYTKRLEARKEQEKIVCTVQEAPAEKRVFLPSIGRTSVFWKMEAGVAGVALYSKPPQ